jgi:hypothetical protein
MKKDRQSTKTIKGSAPTRADTNLPVDYAVWLTGLKDRISTARNRAVLYVNQELIRLYHQIGTEILERQTRQGWGAKVIDRLAADLRDAFPDMKGFSSSNLKYMRFFAQTCPNLQIGQQPADQLPWFHLKAIAFKPDHAGQLNFYLAAVDAQIKAPDDMPTIGLLLYKTKNRLVAEYALSGIEKPMGVAEYRLVRALPEPLDTALPTIEQIEQELSVTISEDKGESNMDNAK